jgi:hypothetical protein
MYTSKDKAKFDAQIKAYRHHIYKSDKSKLLKVVLKAMESKSDAILSSLLYGLLKFSE